MVPNRELLVDQREGCAIESTGTRIPTRPRSAAPFQPNVRRLPRPRTPREPRWPSPESEFSGPFGWLQFAPGTQAHQLA